MDNPKDNEILIDRDVIRRVRTGDHEAFGLLVRRYQARLRAMVAHYIANHRPPAEPVV